MKKYTQYVKGFTLIELLVVIAIIGILASVVLVSLSTARNKGNDARIQAQISQFRAGTELWAGNHNSSYTGFNTAPAGDASGLNALEAGSNWPGGAAPTMGVGGTGASWVVYHALSSNSAINACADSTGTATTTAATLAATKLCDAVTTLP